MRAKYSAVADYFESDVLAKLDQTEVLDRLDEALALHTKAFGPGVRGDMTWGYLDWAKAICKAAPRDETERLAAEWEAKAQTAHTNLAAAAYLEKASEIRKANPPAPRRVRPPVKTPEQVEAERDRMLLKADVAKAAAKERARKAAEDALYKEQLAGRAQWTVGAELRWRQEQGR